MNLEQEKLYLQEIDRVIEKGPYHADWQSLSNMQVPKWFPKAKFGIFIHWGIYSVIAHANEWYPRNMYRKDTEEWNYHRNTYGDHKEFGYKDFIPLFQAEKFNPDEWAELIKESGAQYVFPVAEHHDGFQMYRSEISKFNAYEMGPKRDLLGEMKVSFEKQGIEFCTSSHRAEHWFFLGHGKEFDSDVKEPLKKGDFYWPSMAESPDDHALRSEPYPTEEYVTDWLLRTCEIIDRYQPSLLYFDWWIQHEAFKEPLKKLAAYYYNRGKEWGKDVSICYKFDAMMFGSGIVDVERSKMSEVKPFVWQTDTAIAKNSWCYTDSLLYKSSYQIICNFIDIISKNGNLLLNVGPKGDGSIAPEDKQILQDIGTWMKQNAEAIYDSKPWRIPSEGTATEQAKGELADGEDVPYTAEDMRFTTSGDSIYAFVMKYPEDGKVLIHSMANSEKHNSSSFYGLIKNVEILGFDEKPDVLRDDDGLHITTSTVKSDLPVVIKVTTV
ncbi:alpha-L-fucosidase [Scatolibacter rhodanostii]|uniref:alpha-L-fucosidase n=1 Tax=Scatolibacter rhodanostii TaxID=2014781 RepID=UPI000C0746E0|nr:alpha-L-fucosidase [Scatolibacter rhodanostii]